MKLVLLGAAREELFHDWAHAWSSALPLGIKLSVVLHQDCIHGCRRVGFKMQTAEAVMCDPHHVPVR